MNVMLCVPAWNEQACLAETLDSLLRLDYRRGALKIIVIDDASTDGTNAIARRYAAQYPQISVLTAERNQGSKSKALCLVDPTAPEHAGTDIFVCVDADTLLAPNAISELVAAFDNPRVAIACGQVNTNMDESNLDANFWLSARSAEYVTGQRIVKEAQARWNAVLIASGCMFAVRTQFLRDHHFSERTIAEDMDLTWCAIENGYSISYVPTALCWVNDPFNYHTYYSQVSRWYRGYFQNIKVRRGNLFKNPKLALVAYLYLILNITGLPLFIAAAAMYPLATIEMSAINVAILVAFNYPTKHFVHSVVSVLQMILLSVLNYGIFAQSAYFELVQKRHLSVWVKGH